MNQWLRKQGLQQQMVIKNIVVDPSIAPAHNKNALKFDIVVSFMQHLPDGSTSVVKEQYDKEKYPNLKDFAVMIKKHVGQAKAIEFYHIDWEHQNDANAEMLRNMGTDPLDLDTDSANEWLTQHSVPYRVRRMFNDDQYEIYFDVLNTLEPVGGTSIH